ncbi:hypothetical protein F4819DRAFT_510325 [Hypoxylon fuscum]|nr:hypothetical protein F4819DRAFT_510325 [Hypoxylon fuscum]
MSTSDRFFVIADEPLRTMDDEQELLASLGRITKFSPPVHTCSTGWSFQGFYSGPTSVAYLFFRLSHMFPDLEFKQQSLFEWAEAYLALGARRSMAAPDPAHCGIASEPLAHLALAAVMQRDASLVRRLCALEPALNAPDPAGSNEWLYGRAGFLYFLRMCRAFFTHEESPSSLDIDLTHLDGLVVATLEKTVTRVLASPQPWTWHGKPYLGAAHGALGILTQAVLSQPAHAPSLQRLLRDLLRTQRASGNFPSSATSGAADRLVQFCHGAPGFAVSLAAVAPRFPALRAEIDDALRSARAHVAARGLLTKTPCLCHGIAGNALALVEYEDEGAFRRFLACMGSEELRRRGWLEEGRGGEDVGLFTGEAGRAWVWGLALALKGEGGGGVGRCIGYNDV